MLPKAKETLLFENEWMKNEESVADLIRIITAEPKEVPKLRELLKKTFEDENITHPFSTR
jgi:ABC-type taurine transport system substrate-binding protein